MRPAGHVMETPVLDLVFVTSCGEAGENAN